MDRNKEKDKVLIVLCKIDNCYEKEDNYRDRASILPSFFQELNKVKEYIGADKILFSFYTNDIYEHQNLKPTEFTINVGIYANDITLGEQFYKDENHEIIIDSKNNQRLNIKNNQNINEQHIEILKYIEKTKNTKSIVGILNISDCFENFDINSMWTIIASNGLSSIIDNLKKHTLQQQLKYTIDN